MFEDSEVTWSGRDACRRESTGMHEGLEEEVTCFLQVDLTAKENMKRVSEGTSKTGPKIESLYPMKPSQKESLV